MGKERSIIKIKKKISSSNLRENDALKQKDGNLGTSTGSFQKCQLLQRDQKTGELRPLIRFANTLYSF